MDRGIERQKKSIETILELLWFAKIDRVKVSIRQQVAKYRVYMITWCQRAQNLEIPKHLG